MNNESSFDISTQESNPVQTVAPTKEDNEMLRTTEKITALYCRLSVEDTKDEKKNGKEDPSNSIQHQQVMLMQYAKANRLPNPTYFIDDGYSGVTYDRPGFQKMLSEIEAGNLQGRDRCRWQIERAIRSSSNMDYSSMPYFSISFFAFSIPV